MLEIIIPALLPVATDIIRKAGDRIITGRKLSIEDEVKLMQAEGEKLKALAELDRTNGETSKWVTDFRASFRYFFCLLITMIVSIAIFSNIAINILNPLLDIFAGVVFYLIGHRTYIMLKR